MTLHRVGFFRERANGRPDYPEMMRHLNERAQPDEEKIVAYLRAGLIYIASPGIVKDVVSNGVEPIGTHSIVTDGTWAWPSDLAYYVDKYHVSLPDDFVQHLRSRQFRPPKEKEVDITALEL
ncbi:MAG TPA: hypothetical protein VGG30_06210 [Pirellulales bacterium]|jgi:hypothetical protein